MADALAELKTILKRADLEELAPMAWELYLSGVTDFDQLMGELEGTEAFRRRFAGIRDPETGELKMPPAAYVEYERDIDAQTSGFGFTLTRAQKAALIQQNRSVAEVRQDLDAYAEVASSPYLTRQFYAYTGYQPSSTDLFGLALGMRSDLETLYNQAAERGVDLQEFNIRLKLVPATKDPVTGQTKPPSLADIRTALEGEAGFNASSSVVGRFERLRSLRKAELAQRGQYKAGGAQADIQTEPLKRRRNF